MGVHFTLSTVSPKVQGLNINCMSYFIDAALYNSPRNLGRMNCPTVLYLMHRYMYVSVQDEDRQNPRVHEIKKLLYQMLIASNHYAFDDFWQPWQSSFINIQSP